MHTQPALIGTLSAALGRWRQRAESPRRGSWNTNTEMALRTRRKEYIRVASVLCKECLIGIHSPGVSALDDMESPWRQGLLLFLVALMIPA